MVLNLLIDFNIDNSIFNIVIDNLHIFFYLHLFSVAKRERYLK